MSVDQIFSTARQTLLNNRNAINTTAKNLANANNEGYTRRRVDLSGRTQLNGLLGINSVIKSENFMRIREQFIDKQIYTQQYMLSKYQMDATLMPQIESIFNEPEDGALNNMLSEFWSSWNDLSNNPENDGMRSIVRNKGRALADTFNRLNQGLGNMSENIRDSLDQKSKEINQLIDHIHNLNEKINQQQNALSADLLDERDMTVKKLSEYVDLKTRESDNGQITISTGGVIIISHNFKNAVSTGYSPNDGILKVNFEKGKGTISGGSVGSLLETHNNKIKDYSKRLDTMAVNLASQVNAVHRSGYNLNDITNVNFFAENITGAGEFKLDSAIADNPSLIASSDMAGEPGNGNIAKRIFDLQNLNMAGNSTPADFYTMLITDIGAAGKEAAYLETSQEMVVRQLENQRDSVSGVSVDEEMTNLIEYEKTYQAAAKIIQTVQDMLNTTLNLV
jgi:flagellar hook-associated protein 1